MLRPTDLSAIQVAGSVLFCFQPLFAVCDRTGINGVWKLPRCNGCSKTLPWQPMAGSVGDRWFGQNCGVFEILPRPC